MRSRTILIVSGATLALAACHPPYFHHRGHETFKTVSTLDCPQAQGDLSRKSVSPDGKSCDYASADGSAVTLRLVSLTGTTADSALSPLETSLRAEVPATDSGDGKGEGRVDIDLPGIHIHAAGKDGDKDSSEVKIGRGISIGAGNAMVSDSDDGGAVDIDAHDKGAEIRVNDGHGGTRRNFFLAADAPGPHGYRVAGYEARGPQGGPLVVASLLAKTDDHDRVSHDIHALIRLNVGG